MKRFKLVVPSFLALIFCMLLIAGSTFALFTSQAEASIAVTSGKVKVSTELEKVSLSHAVEDASGELEDENGAHYSRSTDGQLWYANALTVVSALSIKLDRMVPGDRAEYKLNIANDSNVDIKYRVTLTADQTVLAQGMEVTVGQTKKAGLIKYQSAWLTANAEAAIASLDLVFELPIKSGNKYQDSSVTYSFLVEAVQGNAATSGEEVYEQLDAAVVYEPVAEEKTVTDATVAQVIQTSAPSVDDPTEEVAFEVTVPAALVQADDKVEVKVEKLGVASNNEDHTSALSFDLSLLINDTAVQTDSNNPIKVKINVGKDLTITSVIHNGNEITNYTYNSATGDLEFETTHFSPFEVQYLKSYVENNLRYLETSDGGLILLGAVDKSLLANTDLIIKEGVTEVGKFAFENVALKSIKCPSTLKKIGDSAFSSTSNTYATGSTVSVEFNEGLEEIGNRAFKAQPITSLVLPSTIKSINGAFWQCSEIQGEVVIPSGVTELTQTFGHCTKITSVVLPEGLVTLGQDALRETAISTLVIPSTVTTLGEQALRNCNNLTNITLKSTTAPVIPNNFLTNCTNEINILVTNSDVYNALSTTYAGKKFSSNKAVNFYTYAASVTKGEEVTYYETLSSALSALANGDTLTLCSDLLNTGIISLGKDVTFDGNGHKIVGNSCIYVGSNNKVTIKNTVFEYIHNENEKPDYAFDRYQFSQEGYKKGNLSAIYAESFAGELLINGCTFDNVDWDVLQLLPLENSKITITNNTFKHSDLTYQSARFIHIQTPNRNVALTVTVDNNTFMNIAQITAGNACIECYYFNLESSIVSFNANKFESGLELSRYAQICAGTSWIEIEDQLLTNSIFE